MANCLSEPLSPQADSAVSGIFNIGACGIYSLDFYGGNVLISDDFLPPVCFVDFSTVQVLEHGISASVIFE